MQNKMINLNDVFDFNEGEEIKIIDIENLQEINKHYDEIDLPVFTLALRVMRDPNPDSPSFLIELYSDEQKEIEKLAKYCEQNPGYVECYNSGELVSKFYQDCWADGKGIALIGFTEQNVFGRKYDVAPLLFKINGKELRGQILEEFEKAHKE